MVCRFLFNPVSRYLPVFALIGQRSFVACALDFMSRCETAKRPSFAAEFGRSETAALDANLVTVETMEDASRTFPQKPHFLGLTRSGRSAFRGGFPRVVLRLGAVGLAHRRCPLCSARALTLLSATAHSRGPCACLPGGAALRCAGSRRSCSGGAGEGGPAGKGGAERF